MFIVLQHRITNPQTAFARGPNLLDSNGAPQGTRVLQFYPSRDKNSVFCLWESNSVDELRKYADAVMGDFEREFILRGRCRDRPRATKARRLSCRSTRARKVRVELWWPTPGSDADPRLKPSVWKQSLPKAITKRSSRKPTVLRAFDIVLPAVLRTGLRS